MYICCREQGNSRTVIARYLEENEKHKKKRKKKKKQIPPQPGKEPFLQSTLIMQNQKKTSRDQKWKKILPYFTVSVSQPANLYYYGY